MIENLIFAYNVFDKLHPTYHFSNSSHNPIATLPPISCALIFFFALNLWNPLNTASMCRGIGYFTKIHAASQSCIPEETGLPPCSH